MIQSLTTLFGRDLQKLSSEISAYQNQARLWSMEESISNSGGNLALHICGNLQHFIGTILGNSGYVRKRDEEFDRKNVVLQELMDEINTTKEVVGSTLQKITSEILKESYPINVFGKEMTTEFFLLHLSTHLSYHLGQVNYHRRLMDK